ncbi:unnamed protein product [Bemisia tabaci]|uniref:Short-chain dehydrogenase/reductase 3 n=1 Tax=Bemisia tabaci TaxID=7038 RepID=A0A9P0A6G7_BEMTA|nr:unnamed protein product [Bemisia tabaci]
MTSNGTANGTVNGVANGHTELANGEAGKILDGTEKINKLPKEPGKLLLELAWIIFIAFPMILLAFVKKFLPPQKKSLGGETVLITGAANGLGRELALQLAERGCRLALVDIDEAGVKAVAEEINRRRANAARSYVANLGKTEAIRELSKQIHGDYARVDVLVNNAGIISGGCTVQEVNDKDLDAMFQINVLSQFRMIQEFLPGMIKRNHGHIVAVSSVSSYCGLGRASVYTSTKWAINGMMESLRNELRTNPDNLVKTTIVAPYFITTNTIYSSKVDLRIPAMPVEATAREIIDGIERDEIEFSVPAHHAAFCTILKLLPIELKDMILSVLYTKVLHVSDDERDALRNTKILRGEVTDEFCKTT